MTQGTLIDESSFDDEQQPPPKRRRSSDDPEDEPSSSFITRRRKSYEFGNHDTYYQFRHSRVADFDPRLLCIAKNLSPNEFAAKRVLDIGSNSGFITFLLSAVMGAAHVVGIDIDQDMIFDSLSQLRRFKTKGWVIEEPQAKKPKWTQPDTEYPVSLVRRRGPPNYASKPWSVPAFAHTEQHEANHPTMSQSSVNSMTSQNTLIQSQNHIPLKQRFPFNVEFRLGNILHINEIEQYDSVIAFSIVKWIHLNNGDDGVKRFFFIIQSTLKRGGKLYLEAEEWAGYKKSSSISKKARMNFHNIKFRPCQFSDYLIETLGFKRDNVKLIPSMSKPFNKPIIVFTKP